MTEKYFDIGSVTLDEQFRMAALARSSRLTSKLALMDAVELIKIAQRVAVGGDVATMEFSDAVTKFLSEYDEYIAKKLDDLTLSSDDVMAWMGLAPDEGEEKDGYS